MDGIRLEEKRHSVHVKTKNIADEFCTEFVTLYFEISVRDALNCT